MTTGAQAALTITAQKVPFAPGGTLANMPFPLVDLGTPPATGRGAVQTGFPAPQSITVPGMTITFSGLSGLYVRDRAGVGRSPVRLANDRADNPLYLNARAVDSTFSPNGNVTIVLDAPTTTFRFLWGSTDPNLGEFGNFREWNVLRILETGDVVVGSEIRELIGLPKFNPPNQTPVWAEAAVTLVSAKPFQTLVFEAQFSSFEFIPGTFVRTFPVPEPGTLALLAAGLLCLGAAARCRRD